MPPILADKTHCIIKVLIFRFGWDVFLVLCLLETLFTLPVEIAYFSELVQSADSSNTSSESPEHDAEEIDVDRSRVRIRDRSARRADAGEACRRAGIESEGPFGL